jgi:hypothetical protein
MSFFALMVIYKRVIIHRTGTIYIRSISIYTCILTGDRVYMEREKLKTAEK